MLLDQHQEVLGTPSEGNTWPLTVIHLQCQTWNLPGENARVPDIQGIENFNNYFLEKTLSNPRVPARVYRVESAQCLKQ